jgi:hypothetical protein
VAHEAAHCGTLPPDFRSWCIADGRFGWTVAHEAAVCGHLPSDFGEWALTDKEGRPVAHIVARHGKLPAGFERWELADIRGWTVGHEAAAHGHLPPDFAEWALTDKDGRSVAHIAARHGKRPAWFDRWDIANDSGWTVAHEAASAGKLPTGFDRWEFTNNGGLTVAIIAAIAEIDLDSSSPQELEDIEDLFFENDAAHASALPHMDDRRAPAAPDSTGIEAELFATLSRIDDRIEGLAAEVSRLALAADPEAVAQVVRQGGSGEISRFEAVMERLCETVTALAKALSALGKAFREAKAGGGEAVVKTSSSVEASVAVAAPEGSPDGSPDG